MPAEADALCNAEYRRGSDERVNHRNGYRSREWDTRVGTVELAVPKLRSGSYFVHWLLELRRRAGQVLISVVATACLLGDSTRHVEKPAEPPASPAAEVPGQRDGPASGRAGHSLYNRPLDAGPYSFVWVDALTRKVRDGGRDINVHAR
ncbi:transposase [Streptomyces sp. NPDC001774]